jgi:predicted RNA-binding protein with PIN domain
MKIIIDGYNFIHQVDEFRDALHKSLLNARNKLISKFASYASQKRIEILIIFDGDETVSQKSLKSGRVKVIFSKNEKADAVIKRIVADDKMRSEILVISSDREVTDYAKMCGASISNCTDFYEKISYIKDEDMSSSDYDYEDEYKLKSGNRQLSEKEIEEWKKIFKGGKE